MCQNRQASSFFFLWIIHILYGSEYRHRWPSLEFLGLLDSNCRLAVLSAKACCNQLRRCVQPLLLILTVQVKTVALKLTGWQLAKIHRMLAAISKLHLALMNRVRYEQSLI